MDITFLKPMLPTLTDHIPQGDQWVYEIKYDGYRCLLYYSYDECILLSRNQKILNEKFPEVINRLQKIKAEICSSLPLIIDGELCVLESPFKGSFTSIQQRGRLKNKERIHLTAQSSPACFMAFDLIMEKGEKINELPYLQRKSRLKLLLDIFLKQSYGDKIKYLPFYEKAEDLWMLIERENSEGMVAKRKNSQWSFGMRTKEWLKIKNWRYGVFIITAYDKTNGFFHVSVVRDNSMFNMGLFSYGMKDEERRALLSIIQENKISESKGKIDIPPGICVELKYLEIYKEQLRQPSFHRFRFDKNWEECTWEEIQKIRRK